MRTIAHISDLHFGTEDADMVADLRRQFVQLQPDLVVVSGDLTQRARASQYQATREFLDSIPFPYLVVPGNHDVAPWFRLFERLADGLTDYRRYITDDMTPYFADDEIAVLGINTARALTAKGGRINSGQVSDACTRFQQLQSDAVRIIVTHHPFDLPPNADEDDLIGRAHMAMAQFARCQVDMFLAGHLHVTHSCETARRYKIAGHSAIVVQAGTAISHRVRGELNSWNMIRVAKPSIQIERYNWTDKEKRFLLATKEEFQQSDKGWFRIVEPQCPTL